MTSFVNGVIGSNPTMRRALDDGSRYASRMAPILLVGERNVGKDWLARHIHSRSSRGSVPLSKVDCTTTDLDNFLAHYQAAGSSTLLLEDIDQAGPAIQSFLLETFESHVIEAGCDQPEGRLRPRLIATSVCQPWQLAGEQTLRRDLFCLLSPATIRLPALRDRIEDLPAFVDLFLARACKAFGIDGMPLVAPTSLQAMAAYNWPGNLGQLQCCIQRAAMNLEGDSLLIDLDHEREIWRDTTASLSASTNHSQLSVPYAASLPETGRRVDNCCDLTQLTRDLVRQGIAAADKAHQSLYPFVVNSVEKELIAQVLNSCENVQTKAASRLGINRNTLHKKVQEYDLD